jgi:hypothetical protein
VIPFLLISLLIANSDAAVDVAIADDVAACMRAQPYVEESCKTSSFPGWPFDAQDCSYSSPIGTLHVTVADAPAERVAAWVLNATMTVPWTADLQSAHPGAFLQVQKILAVDVMFQRCGVAQLALMVSDLTLAQWPHFRSQGRRWRGHGRQAGTEFSPEHWMFPTDLSIATMQYIAYPFKDGVSVGCPDSEPHCFCRINSISRGQFCAWRAHTSEESEDKCRIRLGYGQGNTDAWYQECLGNHASAWHSDYNDHFSAKLFSTLKVCCPIL